MVAVTVWRMSLLLLKLEGRGRTKDSAALEGLGRVPGSKAGRFAASASAKFRLPSALLQHPSWNFSLNHHFELGVMRDCGAWSCWSMTKHHSDSAEPGTVTLWGKWGCVTAAGRQNSEVAKSGAPGLTRPDLT